jgi:hypothetical protein
MSTLIIYDTTGYVLQQITGNYRVPTGVPYLEVEIPNGQQLKNTDGIGVDVSVSPHHPILENIPPTDIEIIKADLKSTQDTLDFLLLG